MQVKFCKFCKSTHPLTEMYWYSLSKSPQCKIYTKSRGKVYYCNNKEKKKRAYQKYYEANKEKHAKTMKAWRAKNKESEKTRLATYYQENKERIKERDKGSYWEYEKARYMHDNVFKLIKNLRGRMRSALKNKAKVGSAVGDLGCTGKELKLYLESLFMDGMTWENYGEWHIDHIKPLSKFNLSNRCEFVAACHYSNLQPLWASDNLQKRDTYPAPSSSDASSKLGKYGEGCESYDSMETCANPVVTEERNIFSTVERSGSAVTAISRQECPTSLVDDEVRRANAK